MSPRPYGYRWRRYVRPLVILRAGGHCERCEREGRLDCAHLDRTPGHDDVRNLAAFCRRCHRRYDYESWKRKSYVTRANRKDKARPLLALL